MVQGLEQTIHASQIKVALLGFDMCDFDERVAVAPSARPQVNSSENCARIEENYKVV